MLVEPDAEVVQRYPRRQPCPQPRHVVRSLSAEAEGVEELVVNALYDLADAEQPPPEALRPRPAAVTFRRMDDPRSVTIEPPPMIFETFEALVGHVRSRSQRAYALGSLGSGWRLRAKNVSANGWSLVLADPKPKPVTTPLGFTAKTASKSPRTTLDDCSSRCHSVTGQPSLTSALGVSRMGIAEVSKTS